MDSNLFERLLHVLLKTPVLKLDNKDEQLEQFENEYCFDENLQPMFTKEILLNIISDVEKNVIYEIADDINVYISIFNFENEIYLVGPYVREEYSQQEIDNLLIEYHLPSAYSLSLKLYRNSLSLIYHNQLYSIINSCIYAFNPSTAEFLYKRLESDFFINNNNIKNINSNINYDDKNYSSIYRRYDSERAFEHLIRMGDVENVIAMQHLMLDNAQNSGFLKSNTSYINPAVSFAILRTLARKAAESSGLSVITIDEITQRYAQLADSAVTIDRQEEYSKKMILELTKAVREHQLKYSNYSLPVVKTLEYIISHLSDELKINNLAKQVDMSVSNFCKLFKNETGLTVNEYITTQRCKKAAEFLSQTNFPVQEIGSYVGYDDNNYFVKVFKKVYNTTPTQYRKKQSKK